MCVVIVIAFLNYVCVVLILACFSLALITHAASVRSCVSWM